MQPITTQQLITKRLNELSSDLHSQVSQMLNQLQAQQSQTIDEMVQKHLELMLPNLYQQLLTHLTEQVNQKTETHNQQITQYLDKLSKLQTAEIATLKKGREEFQRLQDKIAATLTSLDSVSLLDDSAVKNSLTSLHNSITSLQTQMEGLATSQQAMTSKQTDLSNLIGELERLKEAMASTLMDFKNQQISLRQSLAQFQPLLKPWLRCSKNYLMG